MHDPTHKFEGEVSPGTEKLAKAISLLGQPPFLAIVPFVCICMVLSDDLQKGIICSAASVFAATVLPVVNIMFFSRKYNNSDRMDVVNKEDRMQPLIAGVLGYLVGVILLYLLDAPWPATVLMICYTVVTAAVAVITPYWKISIHTCGVIGPSLGLAFVFWPVGLLYLLILPPVAWSRYVLKKHTPMQLLMGALLGLVLTLIIFWLLL
jgi:membrane-associated phospholipid phosphatase